MTVRKFIHLNVYLVCMSGCVCEQLGGQWSERDW